MQVWFVMTSFHVLTKLLTINRLSTRCAAYCQPYSVNCGQIRWQPFPKTRRIAFHFMPSKKSTHH